MLNYKLEIVGNEYVIFIDHYNEYYVNLLFGRSIYRPKCTHMGHFSQWKWFSAVNVIVGVFVAATLCTIRIAAIGGKCE